MEITREKVFTDLICVHKLGKISVEEEMKLAESLGTVQKPKSERQLELHKQFKGEVPGLVHVTEGGLFGHKKVLDWHANKPSDPNRASIIWIYAVKGSKGSITSWINNYKAWQDLPEDIKKKCVNITFTCGFKKGGYTDDPTFHEHHNKDNVHKLVYQNKMGLTGLYFPFNQIIEGIPEDLFEYLKKHILQDKYRYDHHWEDGDLVVSEQWLTIHKRHEFNNMKERLMHRIAIE
tara:strand:+ start:5275 stop:5976 length:702 start_codon:yes stop_codon:yes gene_type:complete